jgi:hypothetical protein
MRAFPALPPAEIALLMLFMGVNTLLSRRFAGPRMVAECLTAD